MNTFKAICLTIIFAFSILFTSCTNSSEHQIPQAPSTSIPSQETTIDELKQHQYVPHHEKPLLSREYLSKPSKHVIKSQQ